MTGKYAKRRKGSKDSKKKIQKPKFKYTKYLYKPIDQIEEIDIRKVLNYKLINKFNSIPKEVIEMFINASRNIEKERVKKFIRNNSIDVKVILIDTLNRFLTTSNPNGIKSLQDFPKRMKLELDVHYPTSPNTIKNIRRDFYDSQLKFKLLYNIADQSNILEEKLGITKEDFVKTPSKDADIIFKTILTADHIRKVEFYGKEGKIYKYDDIYGKEVLLPNCSNIFFIPRILNVSKDDFILLQDYYHSKYNNIKEGKLYFNIVPKQGPKQGVYILENIEDYVDLDLVTRLKARNKNSAPETLEQNKPAKIIANINIAKNQLKTATI